MFSIISILVMLAVNLDRAKGNGQFTRQVQAERDPRLDNVIFSHSLLFDALVRSRFECDVRCLNHEGCVAFSFVPPSTCRGHSSAPLPCHAGSPSAGAETWLYTGRPGALVFRVAAGIGVSSYATFNDVGNNDDDNPDDCPGACLTADCAPCGAHVRSRLLDNWPSSLIDTVRVSVYKDKTEVAFIDFNGTESTKTSWFSQSRVIRSSWTGVKSGKASASFTIAGKGDNRRFYAPFTDSRGCDNVQGWLMVSDHADGCAWQKQGPFPVILYSKLQSKAKWSSSTDVGRADLLMVTVTMKDGANVNHTCLP